jgi:hypothetical protein
MSDEPADPPAEAPEASEAHMSPGRPTRMPCPVWGSTRPPPFGHAGPAARVNMRCLRCGHLFRDRSLRR